MSIPTLKMKPSQVQVNEETLKQTNPEARVDDVDLPDPLDYMPKLESKNKK